FEPTSFVGAPAGSRWFRKRLSDPRRKPSRSRLLTKRRRPLNLPRNFPISQSLKLKFRISWPARWRLFFRRSRLVQRNWLLKPRPRQTPRPKNPRRSPPWKKSRHPFKRRPAARGSLAESIFGEQRESNRLRHPSPGVRYPAPRLYLRLQA